MADTIQCDLVSPERLLFSVAAQQVQIPSTDGDLTAMPDHVPLITTLRPGVLKVTADKGTDDYVVTGGFVEIGAESISVLAERAIPRADMTQDEFDGLMKEAQETLTKAQENATDETGPVDEAAKLLADMVAVGDEIGLRTR